MTRREHPRPPTPSALVARVALALSLASGAGCGERHDDARRVQETASTVATELRAGVAAAGARVVDAVALTRAAKREFDRVYRSTTTYDLDVTAVGAPDAELRAHEAAIAAMPHLAVGDVTVGYEESTARSLRGVSYARHFRATFVLRGQRVAVSYYAQEDLDLAAFVTLLQALAPIVIAQLG